MSRKIDGSDMGENFEKVVLKARKKAGRTVGSRIQRKKRAALGKVSPARKKLVRYRVRKNGTMVVVDSGANSRAREYGMTISAKQGSALIVHFDKETRDETGTFISEINGQRFLFMGEGEDAKPIAVLKQEVKLRAAEVEKRLSKMADDERDAYLSEIEKNMESI